MRTWICHRPTPLRMGAADLDFALDGYSVIVQARAREAAIEAILPALRASTGGRLGADVLRRLGERGLLAITIPRRLDGEGQGSLPMALVYEELARADASVHAAVSAQVSLVARALLDWGSAEQVDRWVGPLARGEAVGCFALSEPDVGSESHPVRTTATREGGGWVLDGVKHSVVNGGLASVAIVVAMAAEGATAFVVPSDSPGLSVLSSPESDAQQLGTGAVMTFERMSLPSDAVLGEVGGGPNVVAAVMRHGRLATAAGAVGLVQASIDVTTELVRGRHHVGREPESPASGQAILGQMTADLSASRLLVWQAAWLADSGEDNAAAVSAAKLVACDAALRASDEAALLLGDRSLEGALRLERLRRSARALQLRDGGPDQQRLAVAQYLLD